MAERRAQRRPVTSSIPRMQYPKFAASYYQKQATQQYNRAQATQFTADTARKIEAMHAEADIMRGLQPEVKQDSGFLGIRDDTLLLGGIKSGAGTFLGGALDVLGRPATAASGAAIGLARGEGLGGAVRGAVTGALGTKEERSQYNFATALEELGGPFEHVGLRNVLGFGLDMVLDPLNVLAVPAVASKISLAAKAVGRGTRLTDLGSSVAKMPVTTSIIDSISPAIGAVAESKLIRRAKELAGPSAGEQQEAADAMKSFIKDFRYLKSSKQALQVQATKQVFDQLAPIASKATTDDFTNSWRLMYEHHGTPWEDALNAAETVGEKQIINTYRSWFDKDVGSIVDIYSDDFRLKLISGVYGRGVIGGKQSAKQMRDALRTAGYKGGFTFKRGPRGLSSFEDLDGELLDAATVAAYDIAEKNYKSLEDFLFRKYLLGPIRKSELDEYERRRLAFAKQEVGGPIIAPIEAPTKSIFGGTDPVKSLVHRVITKTDPETGQKALFYHKTADAALAGQKVVTPPGYTVYKQKFDQVIIKDAEKQLRSINEFLMPEELAAALDTFRNPKRMAGVFQVADVFNSMWKPLVTTVTLAGVPLFPAFYVRNAIGLIYNNLLAGVYNPADYLRAMGDVVGASDQIVIELSDDAVQKLSSRLDQFNLRATQNNQGPIAAIRNKQLVFNNDGSVPGSERWRQLLQEEGLLNQGSWTAGGATRGGGAESQLPIKERFKLLGDQLLGRGKATTQREIATEQAVTLQRTKDELGRLGIDLTRREQGMVDAIREFAPVRLMGQKQRVFDPFRWGRTLNETMDNIAKIAHVRRKMADGSSLSEAVASANKFIGNYTDTSPTIQKLSSIIPFYRWTRFNLPLQLEMLIKAPQVPSKVAILENTVGGAGSENDQRLEGIMAEGATLPDYIRDTLGIVLGQNADGTVRVVRGFGLPLEDLNKVFARNPLNTIQNLAAEVSPILRAPVELTTNNSFFTKQPITDPAMHNFYKRAYNWQFHLGEAVPPIQSLLQITREESGTGDDKTVRYRSDNPMAMYLMGLMFGRLALTAHRGLEIKDGEQDQFFTALNLGTGVKVKDVNLKYNYKEPLQRQLDTNPQLRVLHQTLQSIPLYPQFEDPELSNMAASALSDIQSISRVLKTSMEPTDPTTLFNLATQLYASKGDQTGAYLAQVVKTRNYKRTGTAQRRLFIDQYPALRSAIEGLSPQGYEWITGAFDDEF